MKITENEGVIYFSYENKHLTEEEVSAFNLWWQAYRQQEPETITHYLERISNGTDNPPA